MSMTLVNRVPIEEKTMHLAKFTSKMALFDFETALHIKFVEFS